MTWPDSYGKSVAEKVEELTRTLPGWGNYVCHGAVSRACRAVTNHDRHRLSQWLNGKPLRQGIYPVRHAPMYLQRDLGLFRLAPTTGNRSCSNA